jgi:hypothetical protein
MNYDASNSHRHSVCKLRVINREDVLKWLICILIAGFRNFLSPVTSLTLHQP